MILGSTIFRSLGIFIYCFQKLDAITCHPVKRKRGLKRKCKINPIGGHVPEEVKDLHRHLLLEACSGQDNPYQKCNIGEVTTVFQGNEGDGAGPYNGIDMNCSCS
jgi:hypothetical protein